MFQGGRKRGAVGRIPQTNAVAVVQDQRLAVRGDRAPDLPLLTEEPQRLADGPASGLIEQRHLVVDHRSGGLHRAAVRGKARVAAESVTPGVASALPLAAQGGQLGGPLGQLLADRAAQVGIAFRSQLEAAHQPEQAAPRLAAFAEGQPLPPGRPCRAADRLLLLVVGRLQLPPDRLGFDQGVGQFSTPHSEFPALSFESGHQRRGPAEGVGDLGLLGGWRRRRRSRYANAWVGLIPWLREHRGLDTVSERFRRFWHNQNQPIEIPHGRTPGGISYPTHHSALVAKGDGNGGLTCQTLRMRTEHIGPTHLRDAFSGQVLSLHPLSGWDLVGV